MGGKACRGIVVQGNRIVETPGSSCSGIYLQTAGTAQANIFFPPLTTAAVEPEPRRSHLTPKPITVEAAHFWEATPYIPQQKKERG